LIDVKQARPRMEMYNFMLALLTRGILSNGLRIDPNTILAHGSFSGHLQWEASYGPSWLPLPRTVAFLATAMSIVPFVPRSPQPQHLVGLNFASPPSLFIRGYR
jgi:hypothetical protein